MMERFLPLEQPDLDKDTLRVVYAQYLRYEKFTDALFDSFSSLQVLTYSASIPMLVKMLNRFDTVECIFGCEKILLDFSDILAAQKVICENLLTVIQGLDDARKRFLLEKVQQGKARFYVVKDAISHAKIYLLKGDNRRLVLVGSTNASERAFSGKQAETLIAFEDEPAWNYYQREYDLVKQSASSEIALSNLNLTHAELLLEEIPLIQEAQQSKAGLTVLVNKDVAATAIPIVIHRVEKLADYYRPQLQPLTKPQNGQVHLTREITGKIIQLVKSRKRTDQTQEPA